MTRRSSLPGADELFGGHRHSASREPAHGRAPDAGGPETRGPEAPGPEAGEPAAGGPAAREPGVREPGPATPAGAPTPPERAASSGRQHHDQKITVYVSSAELMALDRARLSLRGEHGLSVDRGRIVREALALALGDLDAQGAGSPLVHRLRGR